MLSKNKKAWLSSTRAIRNLWGRLRLRNRAVTVISNDCWGGRMHKFYHLPFNTPFIGLFIPGPDYVRLLEDPRVLAEPLNFVPTWQSRYWEHLKKARQTSHPMALLGPEGLEIHFLHYENEDVARQKWDRRVKRIDWDNAIVKLSDRDVFDRGVAERFDALPYPVKVCFTSRPYPGLESVVYLPDYAGDGHVSYCWNVSNLHWSFVGHANGLLAERRERREERGER